MKKLADGHEVPERIYYYLLDFNEANEWQIIDRLFGCRKLNQLNISQFIELFKSASNIDRMGIVDLALRTIYKKGK